MTYSTGSNSLRSLPRKTNINNILDLHTYAQAQGYDTYWYDLNLDGLESLSVMRVSDGKCFIALDPGKIASDADALTKYLHEVGHCDAGAFYNEYAACDLRARQENRADKRAIQLRLTADDLNAAVAEGYTEPWQLANYFGVTESFIRKAVCYYTNGNIAVDLYP